jgi:Dolichyl-phosphate-mannose-protein mannosyltransferase
LRTAGKGRLANMIIRHMGFLSVGVHPSPVSLEPSRSPVASPGASVSEEAHRPDSRNLAIWIGLLVLTGVWAAQLYATWGAWGSLAIDSGHEMYIPTLLAEGKVLYRDVWFPYGPAAPYFNSYLFRLFGTNLNVLYWAGSLSALLSAVFIYLVGRRLSSWHVGLTAGVALLLQAFQPSIFSFPLPYAFATVYGCVVGCFFLWICITALDKISSWWILGAGSVAAAALLFKPEYGTACYATLVPLVAVRAYWQRSPARLVKDALSVLPGIALCGLVFLWMVSLEGFDFIAHENLVGWPSSYFMKTYGKMWLEANGFTVSAAAFEGALFRMVPLVAVLLVFYCLRWKRSDLRAYLFKTMVVLAAILYFVKENYFILSARWNIQGLLTAIFFPRDMVLYVSAAAVIAWVYFWARRSHNTIRNAGFALLFIYSGLAAFRILMNMRTNNYPIFYNGPVFLSFLMLACWAIRPAGRTRRFVLAGELVICFLCLAAVALPTLTAEAEAGNFVPLTTERGTIRVTKHMADNYEAAIAFMREKNAAGESVLSVPEDTSLYFLSETHCPTRVFSFTPGIIAPGTMTDKTIREIERKPVRYLLWSNRTFREFGTPVFGRDFNREIGDYLKANFHPVRRIFPLNRAGGAWTATVWERNPPAPNP